MFIAACGTSQFYSGVKRPKSEVATVIGQPLIKAIPGALPNLAYGSANSAQTRLIAVDGVKVGMGSNKVEVLPGPHQLEVECKIGNSKREIIELYAHAGQIYTLSANYYHTTKECRPFVLQEMALEN